MMQNANPEMWQMLLQKIRANGPLNVLAWREMLNKI
jgi:hypothetical protein